MARVYDVGEAIWICAYYDGEPFHICPECVDHKYCHHDEVSDFCDCKNVFVDDGESWGQCMCYSEEHGRRI